MRVHLTKNFREFGNPFEYLTLKIGVVCIDTLFPTGLLILFFQSQDASLQRLNLLLLFLLSLYETRLVLFECW